MSLEDRVKRLEDIVEHLNHEIDEISKQVVAMSTKVELLISQNEKNYSLLRWIIFILLGIIGVIVGFKVTPPP